MRATKTTVHLSLPQAARWLDRMAIPPALLVALAVLIVAAALSGVSWLRTAQHLAAVPTPSLPVIVIATARPQVAAAAVVQVVAPPPQVRYVVGFDRPNGTALGAIVAPDASTIVARFGDAWLQTTHDGAPIWVRASELGMGLADVAPTATPAPLVVERPIYVVSEPQVPAEAVATPSLAVPTLAPQQLVLLDRGQWAVDAQRAKR